MEHLLVLDALDALGDARRRRRRARDGGPDARRDLLGRGRQQVPLLGAQLDRAAPSRSSAQPTITGTPRACASSTLARSSDGSSVVERAARARRLAERRGELGQRTLFGAPAVEERDRVATEGRRCQ